MKKAKIMLSAIAVLALVGGALAFKAAKTSRFSYYVCNTAGQLNQCQLTNVQGFDVAAASSLLRTQYVPLGQTETDQAIQNLACTNNGVLDCTTSFYYQTAVGN